MDSSSEENLSEISLPEPHRRRRGKTIAESAEIAGINKNIATSIINRYKNDE